MNRIYQNQVAALICPFISCSFSPIFFHWNVLSHFCQELWGLQYWIFVLTCMNSGWMYLVYQKQASVLYLSLYFFIFLSLQFSRIKHFHHTFLMSYLAYKVETWHTHGQWVYVSESGCCFLSVPLFLHFAFFPISKSKRSVTFSS